MSTIGFVPRHPYYEDGAVQCANTVRPLTDIRGASPMAANKRLIKSPSPRKSRLLTQSSIVDFLFALDIVKRLLADVRKRETEIIRALKSGADVEPGRYSASIKNRRLKIEQSGKIVC